MFYHYTKEQNERLDALLAHFRKEGSFFLDMKLFIMVCEEFLYMVERAVTDEKRKKELQDMVFATIDNILEDPQFVGRDEHLRKLPQNGKKDIVP